MSTPLSTRESDSLVVPARKPSRSSLLSSITRHPLAPLLALWIAVVIYFWITEPRYLTGSNISNMLQQNSILFVVALAETVILLMGAVDLSIGGMVVLIGLVLLWINHGIPSVLVIILTVVAGAALSALVNGVPIVEDGKILDVHSGKVIRQVY